MLKIALINPPYLGEAIFEKRLAPLGISYIAAFLNKKGINCQTFDFSSSDLPNEELIEKYKLDTYNLVAFSSYTSFFKDTIALAEAIKNRSSTIKIVMGGHHVTLMPTEVLRDFPIVDFVSIGYGEKMMYELVTSLIENKDYKDIRGIGYRNGKHIIVNDPEINFIDLDLIPFPERNIITDYGNRLSSFIEGNKIINVVSSRGCIYKCHFCVNTKNNRWISRSVDNVIDEVKELYNYDKFNHIFFTDCNFLIDPHRALEILEKIHKFNDTITINFHARCDQIVKNEEIVRKMASLGCAFINIGIESNSEAVLKRFNKNISPEVNQKAIEILVDVGINSNAYMIMFEALVTLDDIQANYDFLKRNKLNTFVATHNIYNSLMPFYGTPYWDEYGKYYSNIIHGIPKTYFQDKDVERFYKVINLFREEYEEELLTQVSAFMNLQMFLPNLVDKNLYQNYVLMQKIQYVVFETLLESYRNHKNSISYDELKKIPLIANYISVVEENKLLLNDIRKASLR